MEIISTYFTLEMLELISINLQLWMAVFTADTLRYIVGAGLTSFILYSWLGAWSASRKIQARKASRQDIRREIKYSLITTGVYAFVGLIVFHALDKGYLQFYESVADYGWLYTVMSLPIVLVLHDTYFYWVHRMMHHPRLFSWMHKVHHLSRTPTPWAAYSFAPPEAFMMAVFVPLVIWAIPLHASVTFIWVTIQIFRNAQGHSGIEFHPKGWVDGPFDRFTTVTHHDMHHQKFNGNYGLYFTWWDRLMGTELPGYKQAFRDAVEGKQVVRGGKKRAEINQINTLATSLGTIKS